MTQFENLTKKESPLLMRIRDLFGDSFFVDYLPLGDRYFIMCRYCEMKGYMGPDKFENFDEVKKVTVKHECRKMKKH